MSDPSVASVVTGAGAPKTNQKLKVESLAKSAYLTGKDLNVDSTEKTLDMIAKVWEMAGLFVNEKR